MKYIWMFNLIFCFFSFAGKAQNNILHLNLGSHNEMSDIIHGVNYGQNFSFIKSRILEIADSVKANGAKWNMQVESNFILACLQNDSAYFRQDDIIQKMDQLSDVEVDPHNHLDTIVAHGFNFNPYNYADLAHLLDSCGLSSSMNVGGFLYNSSDWKTKDENWSLWKNGIQGRVFPQYQWTPTVLWGGGTPDHINDKFPSGIWHPAGPTPLKYLKNDPHQLMAIGNGCRWLIQDTNDLDVLILEMEQYIQTIQKFPPQTNTFYTATIMFDFRNILDTNIVFRISKVLRALKPWADSSKLVWQTLSEKRTDWLAGHPLSSDFFVKECEDVYLNTISNTFSEHPVQIYPNPCHSGFTVDFGSSSGAFQLMDFLGRIVIDVSHVTSVVQVDTSILPAGVYFLAGTFGNKYVVQRVWVTH